MLGCPYLTSLTEADIIFTSSVHCLAMRVTTDYISVGCNRGTSTSDVNADGIVAFGAGKLVALWNSAVRTGCSLETLAVEAPCTDGAWMFFSRIPRIEECIPHFQGIHTTSPKSDIYLSPHPHLHHHLQSSRVTNLAMSEYGYRVMRFLRYWVHRTGGLLQLKLILGVLSTSVEDHGRKLLVTGGSDGLVKIWNVEAEMELLQTIDLDGKLPLEVVIAQLPGISCENCHVLVNLDHDVTNFYQNHTQHWSSPSLSPTVQFKYTPNHRPICLHHPPPLRLSDHSNNPLRWKDTRTGSDVSPSPSILVHLPPPPLQTITMTSCSLLEVKMHTSAYGESLASVRMFQLVMHLRNQSWETEMS
jgi:hypothetical protein